MDAEKLHIKLFADPAHTPKLEAFVPVLHRFIKETALGELLVDVADYSHVYHGPGVVLVGHASDYYLDTQGGRLGLLYSRKRQPKASDHRLSDAFRRAINACRLLEQDSSLDVRFSADEVVLKVVDRLRFANDQASYQQVLPELEAFTGKLYQGAEVRIDRLGEPNELLTLRIKASSSPELGTLLDRLGGPPS